MPTYEYECQKCGKHFDYSQSMLDKPLTKCIHCKGKVTRLIGAGSGLIFKGSGFYITDYKNAKSEKKAISSSVSETKKEKVSTPKPSEK